MQRLHKRREQYADQLLHNLMTNTNGMIYENPFGIVTNVLRKLTILPRIEQIRLMKTASMNR